VKDWQIIADNLHNAGWSLGWISALDREGRTTGLRTPTATESVTLCAKIKN